MAFKNRDQAKKSGHNGSSQFHCYWQISTLIKYPSFLGVKNVRSLCKIFEIKVTEINALLN